ncbi:MAG: hypothetical protein AB9882_13055 [Ignavibacteriaceae bacterium]
MHNFLYFVLFLSFFALSNSSFVFAQSDSSVYYKFTLVDDSEIIGKVDSLSLESFRIITPSGLTILIPKSQIKQMDEIERELSMRKIFQPDPNDTHLFLAPTARSLPAGKVSFSVYELFFPVISVGITDYFMLSGGFSLFPVLSIDEQVKYLSAKISPLTDSKFQISFGSTYFMTWEQNDFAVGFGTATYSSGRFGLTAGLGFGYSDSEIMETPVLILGAEVRISDNAKLITENWFWSGEDVSFLSLGIRFFNKKIAGDIGVLLPTSEFSGSFIPWIGFSYNF